jgi:hypothetical protein
MVENELSRQTEGRTDITDDSRYLRPPVDSASAALGSDHFPSLISYPNSLKINLSWTRADTGCLKDPAGPGAADPGGAGRTSGPIPHARSMSASHLLFE